MNCRTAEGMVNGYINHELSLKELEEFLDHIQTCSSCYDELETYFIVHEAMQQLDDNDSGSVMDFKSLLEQDIRKSRRYIRKKKLGRFSVGVLLCILIVALAAFMVYVVMQMIRII
ncbi:zf-HC2 domain-containing protein [Blautia sp. M29]|uniref:Zf-HC2 domain-containing protein n=2 Tax=Blautia difficilis TaxID=2763027 RepID=A0ABR7IIU8_9FIRM|nr:zf-HC2 domain-containing protein [Blautia difficilis]